MDYKAKVKVRNEAFRFLKGCGENMNAKFHNICGKTGNYDVPLELFQKRANRKNRCLISWKTVKDNHLELDDLNTFEGGVVVNFINFDYFDEENQSDDLFKILRNRLGSNENVSAIISIQTDSGSSSSSLQRKAFKKLVDNTIVNYHGKEVTITEENYKKYALKKTAKGGIGNEKWKGFLFVSIKGGQQDTIETHSKKPLTLFNPACEYASSDVCTDIDLVMSYFALISIDKHELDKNPERRIAYDALLNKLTHTLESIKYDHSVFKGNLLDYVLSHLSITLDPGKLTDPIQLESITIDNFNTSSRSAKSVDLTHSEAVIYQKYYLDKEKGCILTPARPTNVFWSFHLSNMMQQDYSLEEYFENEEKRYHRRCKLLKKK